MKVIPVIDVKKGLVVRAVRGIRELYKPLSDSIYGTCNPIELASKFVLEGFKIVYVADLDSIEGGKVNEGLFKSLRKIGIKMIADIGVDGEEKLKKAIELIDYPVIATESLPSLSFLERALKVCGNRTFLSLDVRSGVVVSRAPEVAWKRVEEAIKLLSRVGIKKVILIDFDRIGSYLGPNIDSAKKLVQQGFETYIGGGVRNVNDVIELSKMGVSGVLVGSALHSGAIRARDLRMHSFI